MYIAIEPLHAIPTFNKRFEIVERKGKGHPDTICDLVMDSISTELAKLYMKESETIQHYNLDKALLVAGEAENRFNGGRILKPMRLVLGDRATFRVNDKILPIEEVAINTADAWFKKNLRFVEREHIEYQFEIKTAAKELQNIFKQKKAIANDTSALVGYAPMTYTERVVLETEKYINSKYFKQEFPESGEDVKVMGFRDRNNLELTVAVGLIDRYIDSEQRYFERKREMSQALKEFHESKGYENVQLIINNLDREKEGIENLYLTVLGTSADSSDSGEVGRGNRVNGVISLMRPSGSEAAAGKNNASHIGKIYNLLCFKIAEEIYEYGVEEVFVWMYNVIGNLIDEPKVIIEYITKDGKDDKLEKSMKDIVEKNLENMGEFCRRLGEGMMSIA